MHPLLRFALLLCPVDYRHHYAASIAGDTDARGIGMLTAVLDVAYQGVSMRIESVSRDASYALRTLAKSPLYTIVAVSAIALSIGANVAVGSVLEGVLFRGLPYPNAQQMVFVSQTPRVGNDFSMPNLKDVRSANHSLAQMGASTEDSGVMTGHGHPVTLQNGRIADGTYFSVLRVNPKLGRFLNSSDDGKRTAVISEALWHRYYGSDPQILNRFLVLDGENYRIAGVAASSMRDPTPSGLEQSDYWRPIDLKKSISTSRGYDVWGVVARLRPGVSVDAAQSDVNRILREVAARYPLNLSDFKRAGVLPIAARISLPVRSLLWLLYAAVAMVLLVACANLANLHLVRLSSREGELAVRSALGASRSRIIAQLSVENFLLAVAGGTLGIAFGWIGLRIFATVGSPIVPRWDDVRLDGGIVAYAVLLILVTTLLTGVMPAILHRRELGSTLKTVGRSDEQGIVKRLRSALVAVEVALALGLVLSAGLVARSFYTLTHVDVGFDPSNAYVVQFGGLSGPHYQTPAAQLSFITAVSGKIRAFPGVSAVSAGWAVPFGQDRVSSGFRIDGQSKEQPSTQARAVDPSYFSTMRIPLLRGRSFTSQDSGDSPQVIIVNAALAEQYFGTVDAVGKRIIPGMSTSPTNPARTIVGIVGNTRSSFSDPVQPEYYMPISQFANFDQFVVRTDGRAAGLAAAVGSAFQSVDSGIPAPDVQQYSSLLAKDALQSQASTMLFGILALIALLLALGGIYAISSYGVSQRTHEFGIRKAIGAGDGAVLSDVIGKALTQAAFGVAIGLALAAAFMHLMSSILFETSPLDPGTYIAVVALVIACAVFAALLPALRATHIQPARALRYE